MCASWSRGPGEVGIPIPRRTAVTNPVLFPEAQQLGAISGDAYVSAEEK